MMCDREGAFVEFDAPATLVRYSCGPRNTGIIPAAEPLRLAELNPEYVHVRRRFWEFWRTTTD